MIVGSGSGCGWARSRLAFQGCDVRTRRSRRPTPEEEEDRLDGLALRRRMRSAGRRTGHPVDRHPYLVPVARRAAGGVTPSAVTAFSSKSAATWDAARVRWPNWSARRETASPSSESTPDAAVDPRVRATPTAHRAAVLRGGGTMAGLLHRNVIACGFTDTVHC